MGPAAISATRPLRQGVIADFEVTEQMLRRFIAKVVRSRSAEQRPEIMLGLLLYACAAGQRSARVERGVT